MEIKFFEDFILFFDMPTILYFLLNSGIRLFPINPVDPVMSIFSKFLTCFI